MHEAATKRFLLANTPPVAELGEADVIQLEEPPSERNPDPEAETHVHNPHVDDDIVQVERSFNAQLESS